MCSANIVKPIISKVRLDDAVKTTSRVISGLSTAGLSEVARNNLPKDNLLNRAMQLPGEVPTGFGGIQDSFERFGLTKGDVPPAPQPPAPAPSEPPPQFAPATPSELAAMLRRRRLAALRMGLASTIRTSGYGLTDAPSLLTPAAAGTSGSGKQRLGQ